MGFGQAQMKSLHMTAICGLLTGAERRRLGCLLLLALVLRLGYLLVMLGQIDSERIMNLAPDTIAYVTMAKQVAAFHLYPGGASLIYGPGYGIILGLFFMIFGVSPVAALVLQIVVSSVNCLLIYLLARRLAMDRSVALIAGVITAISFTSISLAASLLSDTFFFFFFLVGNILFLKGLTHGRRTAFAWSGIFIGLAILIRAVVQFWPFVMIILLFAWPRSQTDPAFLPRRRDLLARGFIAPAIALLLMAAGISRNYYYDKVPVVAGSGPQGIGRLTSLAEAIADKRDISDVYASWIDQYRQEHQIQHLSVRDAYAMYAQHARQLLAEHPAVFIQTYFSCVRDNILAGNELYLVQLPQSAGVISTWMGYVHKRFLRWAIVALTAFGFGLMAYRRQWAAVLFLGVLYVLLAVMVGFGMWQGSRLFFPAEISWPVAVAVSLTVAGKGGWQYVGRRRRRRQG